MRAVTDTAVDEAVAIARTALWGYRVGLNQNLPFQELHVLATAYGKACHQVQEITGWTETKMTLVVVNGLDY